MGRIKQYDERYLSIFYEMGHQLLKIIAAFCWLLFKMTKNSQCCKIMYELMFAV